MNAGNVAQNAVSSSTLLCLDIDCLEELFEWLSFRDLLALRASCKRMKLAVDYFIQTTYPNFFAKLTIRKNKNLDDLQNCNANICNLFKHIEFYECPLTDSIIERLSHILKSIEKITIWKVDMNGDFYENFLRNCTKLKYLHIRGFNDFSTATGFEWLQHSYPTLEHLCLWDFHYYESPTEQLQSFFKKNPNTRRFSIEPRFLQMTFHWLMHSGAELDQLDIVVGPLFREELSPVYDMLNALFENGFYKRLHLYIYCIYLQSDLNRLPSLRALEKVHLFQLGLRSEVTSIDWCVMTQLKEFSIDNDEDVFDTENRFHINVVALANCLPNIERFHFGWGKLNHILPIIHRCSKLKEIQFDLTEDDAFCNENVIDLRALNEERRKCPNASKIVIYVSENDYLPTKRTIMRTDFDLIELRRTESKVCNAEL